ncbi:hypothetical protein CAPTEDRAFT_135774, partial [Capitella teleta]
FRFSNFKEKLLMILGTVVASLHGCSFPLMIIIFGDMTDMDALYFINMTDVADMLEDLVTGDVLDEMKIFAFYYIGIGAAVFLLGYIQTATWQTAAYGQCRRIRVLLLEAILRQEIGWYDVHEIGELNTRISDDVDQIEAGIGDKLSLFFQQMFAFLAGFIVGFIYGWELTLVILAVSPLLAIAGGFMARVGANMASKELEAYAKAGAIAEEVLGAFRTVVAFSGEEKECERYAKNLKEAKETGLKKGIVNGLGMGTIFFLIFASYALAFWYGTQLMIKDGYSAGNLMTVFFCVLIGAFSIGNAAPNIQDFANSRGAAYAIYNIIDMIPSIDSKSTEGLKPNIRGNVEFRGVHFSYPSRDTVKVLKGLDLSVNVGQTVALVGSSGCGKSTTVSLLQRFYDPLQGTVLVDGIDIREMNVTHLRNHIGVVSQEPVLFATTIAENISYGKEGCTQEEIEKAAMNANAHDFIMKLPQKYKTLVGDRGAQLSGGQKQRVAIARALVRDPKILLLDEATSALDTESEATVQAALDNARMGRTTLVIAHRLSTIRTADLIASFDNGVLAEKGTHDELMRNEGIYCTLVNHQVFKFMLKCTCNVLFLSQSQKREEGEEDNISIGSGSGKFGRSISVESEKKMARSVSEEEALEEELEEADLSRIMRMNSPEWAYIMLGCLAALVSGGIQPSFAIVFSEILASFGTTEEDKMEDDATFYSLMFLLIGIVAAISFFLMSAMFAVSGQNLTMRMRDLTFKSLLKQDMSYFDDHHNSVGALCTRLSNDASAVQGATGARLATMLQSLASIGAGIAIGFAYSWELTLMIIAFAPFILMSSAIQMKVVAGNKEANRAAMEGAGKVAIEGIENIRTVAALTKEEKFHQDYCDCIVEPYKTRGKRAHAQGLAYGLSQGIVFLAYAASFTLGSYLIDIGRLDFGNMFKVFSAIVFGAMSAGQASSFAPDYGKAKIAAAKIFQLFDRVPLIDSSSPEGESPSDVAGCVTFKDVKFNYPTRPDVPVLQGLSLSVKQGETVALVGSSGCGKSTSVQLLERFYDPLEGEVAIDGKNIRSLNLRWLRRQMGIVSQEPVLFDCTIAENIAYGDTSRDVQMSEIIEAAMNANIHNKISSLPLGYETKTGEKGAQLSGGEKQRVAIARALVRNPKILLLDEATSALDTESEKVVQAALDRAQEGRTSLVIAHRLSTIQNADQIVVFDNGKIAEIGTHSELIQMKGIYYKLNNAQLRQK